MSRLEIDGTATDEESAAIAVVVAHVMAAEDEVVAAPPQRPQQSDWVMTWRPKVKHVRSQEPRPAASSTPRDDED